MRHFKGWGGAAVVTGASSGIGLELARVLAERGLHLFLVARSQQKLQVLANELSDRHAVEAVALPLDLTTREGIDRLTAALETYDRGIDLLVNNAGFAIYGRLGNRGLAREYDMIQLNVVAPTLLAANLLPAMIRRGHGLILNVASTAGFAPMPWAGTYAATKAYLISWTHSLDTELRGTGVRASVLCPGSTSTNFHNAAGIEAGRPRRFPPQQSPQEVARACLRGIDKGHRIIVTGAVNRLQASLMALLPGGIASRLTEKIMAQHREAT